MTAGTAAFFRFEGALSPRQTVHAAGWLATNSQTFGERLSRLGAVVASAPFSVGGDVGTGTRLAWSSTRGMTEDRLEILGEEYWHTHLEGRLLPIGLDLLERARADRRRIILISDSIDVIVKHAAASVRADHWICNHMELRNGRATGRLADPVVTHPGGRWLAEWAQEHAIDLRASCGYGASAADAVLLAAIGLPCAVRPDWRLRRMARDLDWPVVDA